MFKSFVKYSLIVMASGVAMVVAMHYGDDSTINRVREELENVKATAREAKVDINTAIDLHVALERDNWVSQIVLAMNIAELDNVIANAREG